MRRNPQRALGGRGAPACALAAALFALAGCGGALDPFPEESLALPCPNVRVIADGDAFLVPGAAPGGAEDAPALAARIVGFDALCEYDDDEDPRGGMTLSLTVAMGAERGEGAPDAPVPLPWFVAAIGPDRTVANKRVFTTEAAFDSPDARIARVATGGVDLRFPAGAARPPWEYEVLVGFQLDRRQLEDRRRARR